MDKSGRQIWVICGNKKHADTKHIRQLISKAKELAGETGDVTTVCNEAPDHDNVRFASATSRLIHSCIKNTAQPPDLILFPSNEWGRCCAAEAAVMLGGGLTADCVDIEWSPEQGFIFKRAALSSSVIAGIVCINTKLAMCTVKENTFPEMTFSADEVKTIDDSCKPEDVLDTPKRKIIDIKPLRKTTSSGDLSGARLVFGFGRGLDDISLFKKAAEACGAEIAGSRPVVEAGRLEKERQVGQSGISVAPAVYVAFGISGASQHMAGIKNAKTVIAVNKDPEAPIFRYADYKIVEDCDLFLEELYAKAHNIRRT